VAPHFGNPAFDSDAPSAYWLFISVSVAPYSANLGRIPKKTEKVQLLHHQNHLVKKNIPQVSGAE